MFKALGRIFVHVNREIHLVMLSTSIIASSASCVKNFTKDYSNVSTLPLHHPITRFTRENIEGEKIRNHPMSFQSIYVSSLVQCINKPFVSGIQFIALNRMGCKPTLLE